MMVNLWHCNGRVIKHSSGTPKAWPIAAQGDALGYGSTTNPKPCKGDLKFATMNIHLDCPNGV